MSSVRATAPVSGSVRWLLLSILAWEVAYALRSIEPAQTGSWLIGPIDLLLISVIPALTAFAFVRLFLATVQASYGSLNTYTLTSSPWAWAFWIGLAAAMVGQGGHLITGLVFERLPDVVANGEFADAIQFLRQDLTYWLLGTGFLVASMVILFLGQGQSPRVVGLERWGLGLGSIITYGTVIVVVGVEGEQLVPAILGSGLLAAVGLWILPPSEISRDSVGLLMVPGTVLAGLTLLIWGLLVGGQPTWPW